MPFGFSAYAERDRTGSRRSGISSSGGIQFGLGFGADGDWSPRDLCKTPDPESARNYVSSAIQICAGILGSHCNVSRDRHDGRFHGMAAAGAFGIVDSLATLCSE